MNYKMSNSVSYEIAMNVHREAQEALALEREELANYRKFKYQIENHEYEYCNYGTQWKRGDDVCYRVAGGGLSNGNAYAEVERINYIWYYCEYGKHPSRSVIGTKIVWSNEYYQGNPPYEYRNFDILP
tara:strand:- start:63 stop:446 length:384 start_codon:yes stop_codon:yes gene_type:complete